ncbi:uncharacterized protein LOC123501509 [Portunus trituberculatus]|uniref:uncharacterized protein LOC123501509 n=1 Tax=Portunus trituberculatus TaxID=210409 RepID=UPI001E1CEA81|nr:uncharacterized protein LOC123501509 [Portunus trituberculatus]
MDAFKSITSQHHRGPPSEGSLPSPSLWCWSSPPCFATSAGSVLLPSCLVSAAVASRGPYSVTINHYESVCRSPYSYRRRGLMVRRHNVVSARLWLSYRPPWWGGGGARLCHAPQANTIEHYCLACPTVRHLLPQGLPLDAVCRHLLPYDVLDELLVRFPRFGGFS